MLIAGGWVEPVTAIGTCAAALASAYAAWKAAHAANAASAVAKVERDRRDEELRERKSARIRASLTAEQDSGSRAHMRRRLLEIRNVGLSEARNLDLMITPTSGGHHPFLLHDLPVAVLAPGTAVAFVDASAFGDPDSFEITATWVDDIDRNSRQVRC